MSLVIDGQKVEQFKSFKYLGAIVKDKGSCVEDVKARIGMPKVAFNQIKELVTKGLKKDLKRMVSH